MAAIQPKNTDDILVDSIGEKNTGVGLTLVDDTTALTTLFTNTITERTVSNGVTIEQVRLLDGFMQLVSLTAPANPPGSGWRMYSDFADDELKVRSNVGQVVQLSELPVLYTTADGGVEVNSGGNTDVITQAITAETDELILAIGNLQCSQSSAGGGLASSVRIGGGGGKELVETGHAAETNGNTHNITAMHVGTGFSGSTDIILRMRRLSSGDAHTASSRLHIFQFKFRT